LPKSLYREWMMRLQMVIAARETAPANSPALRKAPHG